MMRWKIQLGLMFCGLSLLAARSAAAGCAEYGCRSTTTGPFTFLLRPCRCPASSVRKPKPTSRNI